MDLTKKLRSLVGRQGQLPEPAIGGGSATCEPALPRLKPSSELPADPSEEEEVLSCIEAIYCSAEGAFDASDHELKKLPEELDLAAIQLVRTVLRRQLAVVSKRVSDLILQNQSWYALELQRVTELQENLDEACSVCIRGRRSLSCSRRELTVSSLGLLAACRRRQQLLGLLRSLHLIKALQETDARLRELLEEEDYPGAIQLGLTCHRAASTFRHYLCVGELSAKLQETLEMTEEQLDVALSRLCVRFDHDHYGRLDAAYRLLGKTQMAAHQLLMHFSSAVHNSALAVVRSHAAPESGQPPDLRKAQYADLCKLVPAERFLGCLVDLCQALWQVMCSYRALLCWHHDREPAEESLRSEDIEARYVSEKLREGLQRVWQDIQKKVTQFLLASNIAGFKFNQFIQVLDIVRRLMDLGQDFCGSPSEELQQSLRQQSFNYFKDYHRSCMEELRMFLENESWELVPVKPSFSILQLQELRFLGPSTVGSPGQGARPRGALPASGEPFDPACQPFALQPEEEEEDLFDPVASSPTEGGPRSAEVDSDDSDVPEELKRDYVDEMTGDAPLRKQAQVSPAAQASGSPFVSNTSLNVLRQFGKYMKMMDVLHTIAFDVFLCMSQLFNYYLYAVYVFFAKEMSDFRENSLSVKAQTALQKIREDLCEAPCSDAQESCSKMQVPRLSPVVDLGSPEKLFGLAPRVVAAESLLFLAEQFVFLAPHLEALLPSGKRSCVQAYLQTVSLSAELRQPAYMTVAARAIGYDQVLSLMERARWDLHEIMSQHSYYVDVLVRELQLFLMRLSEVAKQIPLPLEVTEILWEHAVRIAHRTFIEGFSQAKRCTPEGRAQMQLDHQQFVSKVEKLRTQRQPLPDRELVDAYVKAYYLTERQLRDWILARSKDYSTKQLVGLVTCISHLNKKSRQALLGLIEDISAVPPRNK
ncbi:vacuolar protein sorting 50 isoform X2 [Amblyomma americanum]